MITLGLSHDVIALDQRVVGLLNTHLGYNLKFSKLQANCSIYLSVEDCLRCVCKEANITLGQLDRTLFSFAGLSAVEYLINYDLSRSTIA
jgi:thermostable 8-oxoguanine DNA glycosylase